MPRWYWDLQLYVESVLFPTEPPLGSHGGANILETGGWAAQKIESKELRMPYLCEESVLCV